MKLCECGCGKPTALASKTRKAKGHVKGKPLRFVNGHQVRKMHKVNHKHGKSRDPHNTRNHTPIYTVWVNMKQRCLNPKHPSWKHYGGRGIDVCDRWVDSFKNFLTDMGTKPKGKWLDRVDNNGNYEPSNCRWVTPMQNINNRRPYGSPSKHRS